MGTGGKETQSRRRSGVSGVLRFAGRFEDPSGVLQDVVPVRSGPVNPAAGGTLTKRVLGLENIGGNERSGLFRGQIPKDFVAEEAAGEKMRPVRFEAEGAKYFPKLAGQIVRHHDVEAAPVIPEGHVLPLRQDGPPLPVPAIEKGAADVAPVEDHVNPQGAQPSGQLPQIPVHQEFHRFAPGERIGSRPAPVERAAGRGDPDGQGI